MKRVERPHRHRERFERPRQDRRRQLQEGQAGQQLVHVLAVGRGQAHRVDPRPYLVLEQAAGHKGSRRPERDRGMPILREQLGQGDRCVDVDQRSARSYSSSFRTELKVATGRRGGGPSRSIRGGVTNPSRTAWASRALDAMAPRPSLGGPSSATTRSRSVTRTVSPAAAIRTYSLSLFFSTFNPTALTVSKVASRSYFVNRPRRRIRDPPGSQL